MVDKLKTEDLNKKRIINGIIAIMLFIIVLICVAFVSFYLGAIVSFSSTESCISFIHEKGFVPQYLDYIDRLSDVAFGTNFTNITTIRGKI